MNISSQWKSNSEVLPNDVLHQNVQCTFITDTIFSIPTDAIDAELKQKPVTLPTQ